jgi:hypothetical protein
MTFEWLVRVGDLDWLAILVATAAAMVLGFLWYGPLFGKVWASKSKVGSQTGAPGKMLLTGLYYLFFNAGLQYLGAASARSDRIEHALVVGIVVGILVAGPALYSMVVWAKRHPVAFVIDLTHWMVIAAVSTYLQGLII